MRLAVEGWRPFVVGADRLLTSTLESGVRRDGGDAEEGGRLLYAAPSGLSLEAVLRGLVAHESSSYEEWGASGALPYAPGEAVWAFRRRLFQPGV